MAKINGRDRMRKVLKALPVEIRKQLRAETFAAAQDMANMMRRLVPVDHGDLQKSIKVDHGDVVPELYNKSRARRVEKDPELAAVIHVDEFYAAFREFGTSPHINQGKFAGTENPGTPAQPYFWPSYRSQKKQAIARINKAARRGIKQGLR